MIVSEKIDRQLEFRVWLQEEFSRRCRTNAKYSVRSMAKYLAMSSSALSQILSGKRQVSDKMMERIFSKLESRPALASNGAFSTIDLDVFAAISDWYHFAILDLVQIRGFKNDANWIAVKLGIQVSEASFAVERLKRLGLIVEQGKVLRKTQKRFSNYSEGVTSSALKEYQRQVITKAMSAIDDCPQEKKDITGITIAANSKTLAAAKEKIKRFRRDLCRFMEEQGEQDSVYHLTIQLYPVTKFDL